MCAVCQCTAVCQGTPGEVVSLHFDPSPIIRAMQLLLNWYLRSILNRLLDPCGNWAEWKKLMEGIFLWSIFYDGLWHFPVKGDSAAGAGVVAVTRYTLVRINNSIKNRCIWYNVKGPRWKTVFFCNKSFAFNFRTDRQLSVSLKTRFQEFQINQGENVVVSTDQPQN